MTLYITDAQWDSIQKLPEIRFKDCVLTEITTSNVDLLSKIGYKSYQLTTKQSILLAISPRNPSITYEKGKPSQVENWKIVFSIGKSFDPREIKGLAANQFQIDETFMKTIFAETPILGLTMPQVKEVFQNSVFPIQIVPRDYIVYLEIGTESFDDKSLDHISYLLEDKKRKLSCIEELQKKFTIAKTELRTLTEKLEKDGHGDQDELQRVIDLYTNKKAKIQAQVELEKNKSECAAALAKKLVDCENAKKALAVHEKELQDLQTKSEELNKLSQ